MTNNSPSTNSQIRFPPAEVCALDKGAQSEVIEQARQLLLDNAFTPAMSLRDKVAKYPDRIVVPPNCYAAVDSVVFDILTHFSPRCRIRSAGGDVLEGSRWLLELRSPVMKLLFSSHHTRKNENVTDLINIPTDSAEIMLQYSRKHPKDFDWSPFFWQSDQLEALIECAVRFKMPDLADDAFWQLYVSKHVPLATNLLSTKIGYTNECLPRFIESVWCSRPPILRSSFTPVGKSCLFGQGGEAFIQHEYDVYKDCSSNRDLLERITSNVNCQQPCRLHITSSDMFALSKCCLKPKAFKRIVLVLLVEAYRVQKDHTEAMMPVDFVMHCNGRLESSPTWCAAKDYPFGEQLTSMTTYHATAQFVFLLMKYNTLRRIDVLAEGYSRRRDDFDSLTDRVLCKKGIANAKTLFDARPLDLIQQCYIIQNIKEDDYLICRGHGKKIAGRCTNAQFTGYESECEEID